MQTTYKLQESRNGQYTNYRLSVPARIGRQLLEGTTFECAADGDGLLYRPSSMTTCRRYQLGHFVNGRTKTGKPHVAYWVTVPKPLGERLAGRMFTCDLTEGGLDYKISTPDNVFELPKWAQTAPLADELAKLTRADLANSVYFTGDVVAHHEAVWRFDSYLEAAGDLCACVREGDLVSVPPAWSEPARNGAAMIRVADEMTLIVVRGDRHARGETWRKPYLAIKAFYGPTAGVSVAA